MAKKHTVEEVRELASELGYELRKKGVKREKHEVLDADGNPIRNAYFPHLTITATCLPRTWKMLKGAKVAFRYPEESPAGVVWEEKLLLINEHVVRFINKKIDDKELGRAIERLANPLPKREYIKRGKKTDGK